MSIKAQHPSGLSITPLSGVALTEISEDFASSPLQPPWYDNTTFVVDNGRYRYDFPQGTQGSPSGNAARILFASEMKLRYLWITQQHQILLVAYILSI
jgi:hypothetical protein